MEPRIVTILPKKLIGKSLTMSLAQNNTVELWQSFMPLRKQITNYLNSDLLSLTIYPHQPNANATLSPTFIFEKWAAIEVANHDVIPNGLHPLFLPGGLYAVFTHKGSHTDTSIFHYIFTQWLPTSPYHLDVRPHFEILSTKYMHNNPNSEEDIYIPIHPKLS